jgi:hypothetical protein
MTEEWPSYFTGRREHIHALGVISLSYSAFERDLFTLYAHQNYGDIAFNSPAVLCTVNVIPGHVASKVAQFCRDAATGSLVSSNSLASAAYVSWVACPFAMS